MAEEIDEYRTPRSFRIAGLALGIAFAIFLSLKLVFDPSPSAIANRAVSTVIAGCIVLALYSMRAFFSPHAYSVFVAADGIRIGTSGRWIMWSDIKTLRENALFGRIELIDHEHRHLGSIQHRIEEFHRLLEIVRQAIHRYAMTAPPQRHFGNRARAVVPIAAFVAGVCGVYVYLYFTDAEHPWWALPAIPLYVWYAYDKTKDEVRELDILDHALVVSTIWRARRFPREMIASVRAALFDNDVVQPRVELHGDGEVSIAPAGSDVMEVYRAVVQWFEEDAGGGAG